MIRAEGLKMMVDKFRVIIRVNESKGRSPTGEMVREVKGIVIIALVVIATEDNNIDRTRVLLFRNVMIRNNGYRIFEITMR